MMKLMRMSNYVEKIMDEEARQNKPRKSGKGKDKMNVLMKGDKKIRIFSAIAYSQLLIHSAK